MFANRPIDFKPDRRLGTANEHGLLDRQCHTAAGLRWTTWMQYATLGIDSQWRSAETAAWMAAGRSPDCDHIALGKALGEYNSGRFCRIICLMPFASIHDDNVSLFIFAAIKQLTLRSDRRDAARPRNLAHGVETFQLQKNIKLGHPRTGPDHPDHYIDRVDRCGGSAF